MILYKGFSKWLCEGAVPSRRKLLGEGAAPSHSQNIQKLLCERAYAFSENGMVAKYFLRLEKKVAKRKNTVEKF